MADNRTMAQMLQTPIEGYEDAIVVPPINANNFELKQPLINLVQSNKFTGRQDPHNHLRFFNKVTSTFRHPEVPNTSIKLLLFPFSLDGEARDWLDKEPPRLILTWDNLVSKFINQFFPPSKTTYLRNKITNFFQEPNESFNEAWERFKGLLRQCPHHGFSELHQLDTFYNSLNSNDQDALDSAAAASLEDKMYYQDEQNVNEMKALVTTPARQSLKRTSALADSGASINLLPHSIYKKLELEALTPTRMTLELANRSISHPMGIAEDVVVRVDGFTFLADFVVVNFEPDPRDKMKTCFTMPLKSEKNKEKNFVHAISVIDFSKDDPFSGSTTTHSDDPSPSSSPVKTSDNFVKFADELAPLDSLPPGNDDSTLKKDLHEENFQEDVEIKNSNVSDKLGNFHQNSDIESSFPCLLISLTDSKPTQEEIDIFLVPDDLIPPGVENDDSEDEVNESPNLDHQDDPSIPRPPPEPPDIEKCFKPEAGILIIKEFKGVSKSHDFMTGILPTLPTLVSDLTFTSSFFSFESEDTIFDPDIFT
ncbi:reverse transcriptase domain-containing protein [Tanacetum coccineum]